MLIPLHTLVNKYNIQFKGILHVGAHECEELSDYQKYLPIDKMLWVEAMSGKVKFCKENLRRLSSSAMAALLHWKKKATIPTSMQNLWLHLPAIQCSVKS